MKAAVSRPNNNGSQPTSLNGQKSLARNGGVQEVMAVIEHYRQSGLAARWPIPPALESAPEVVYRNDFVNELVKQSVPDILERYVYFSVSDMQRLLRLARKYVLVRDLSGIGLDLGSGSGLLASVVASQPKVESVLAVEVCEMAANRLIPKVSSWVLQEQSQKVVPVIGTFNDLRLPANSVDFIVEIDSFHHADDLMAIMTECHRVLKPGGVVLAFDRCWTNEHPDWDLERLLSVVYTPEFLAAHGYPQDLVLTRRENGEHEYKLFQWQEAFAAAGLSLERMCKFYQEVSHKHALKGVLSILPKPIRRLVYSTENASLETVGQWGTQQLKNLGRILSTRKIGLPEYWPQNNVFSPRETTAFLLQKKS